MFKKTARGGSYNAQLPCTIAHRAQLPTGRNYQCAGRVPEALVGETTDRARASSGSRRCRGRVEPLLCLPATSHTFLSAVRSGQRSGHGPSHGQPPRKRPENDTRRNGGSEVHGPAPGNVLNAPCIPAILRAPNPSLLFSRRDHAPGLRSWTTGPALFSLPTD